MKAIPEDKAREERIIMEVVVDAYDEEERATGWYCYLDDAISYASQPLLARCVTERAISPLQVGDEVEVLGMAPAGECKCEASVT